MGKFSIEQIDYLREKAAISYEEAMETLKRFDGDLALCLVDLERRGRIKPAARGAGDKGNHYRYEYRYGQEPGANANWHGRKDPWHQEQSGNGPWHQARHADPSARRGKAFVLDGQFLKQALLSHMVVRKGEAVVADLPVAYLLGAVCMAPHLVFASVLLIFLMGYRIKWENKAKQPQPSNDFYAFVDKTAANIRRTADSFVQAVRSEVCPQPPREEDRAGYGDTRPAAPPQEPQAQSPDETGDDEPGEITIE
jgi:hypothetical protein